MAEDWYIMSQENLSELCGMSVRRLQQINAELPDELKLFVTADNSKGQKKYDGREFVKRFIDYKESLCSDGDSFDDVKKQHEKVKIAKSRIELEKLRGSVVDRESVLRAWQGLFIMFRERLMHVGIKVAPALTMEPKTTVVQDTIDREIRDALTMLSEAEVDFAEKQIDTESDPEQIEI